MSPFSQFLTIAVIHLLAVATPGPDFAVVLRQSISYGRTTALQTSIGVGLGVLVHTAYTVLGIGLLISQSVIAFTLMKFAGAAYLVYLGVKIWGTKPAAVSESGISHSGPVPAWRSAMWTGFLTNGTNPKVTLFFLALFTAVVSADTPLWLQAGYGLYMSLATTAWFAFLSAIFGHPPVREWFSRSGIWFERITGAVLIAFGIVLALSQRS